MNRVVQDPRKIVAGRQKYTVEEEAEGSQGTVKVS
jgi:hypothetical protein